MADMHHYETAISQIVSTATEEEVVIRGHRLSELIQNASFADAVFLMLTGRMPSKAQAGTLCHRNHSCKDCSR